MDDLEAALIGRARGAAERAYAPYSQFRVGAVVRDAVGHIYPGCNVESVSHGLTICAERNAIFSALSGATRPFSALAVACLDTPGGCMPCGACRQVIQEHLAIEAPVFIDGSRERSFTAAQLLPHPFHMETRPTSTSAL